MEQRIGLIGLGSVGHLYVGHLLGANGRLVVFDADVDRVARAVAQGASAANSAAELAATCDVLLLSLPSPEAVEQVMLGGGGVLEGAHPGALVIDASTIDPRTNRRMYHAAREQGVRYLDAPISGGEPGGAGTDGARQASITFMVGGDREAYEQALAVFGLVGKHWFYLGPSGAGSTVKLLSNLMAGLHNLVATEALVLGAAAGFGPELLLEVFEHTDARSFTLTDYLAPRIRRRDFEPGFSVDLMYKDHRLAADLGRDLRVPLLLNEVALQVYQMLRAQGLGSKDHVETLNFWGKLAGADPFSPRPARGAEAD